MPVIKVRYDMTNTQGGTPFFASHKEFERLKETVAFLSGEVEDDASSKWETPCLSNNVIGYVTIDGPYPLYRVTVCINGSVVEDNTLTSQGNVKGGLSWIYNDDKGAIISRGLIQPSPELRVPRVTQVAHSFSLTVPNKVTTRLCSAGINGGIIIAPNQTVYSSVRVKLHLSYYIQFVNAWTSPGRIRLFLEEGETTIQKRTIRQEVEEGIGGLLPGALFSFVDISTSPDFQDPELAEQTGLLANLFDAPEIQRRIEASAQEIEQPFRDLAGRAGNGRVAVRTRRARARGKLAAKRG